MVHDWHGRWAIDLEADGNLTMTNIQKARDIMSQIRWNESRNGGPDYETRRDALNVILGLMNAEGDSRLKGLTLAAIQENRKGI